MTFSGQCGASISRSGNIIAGFIPGATSVHNLQTLTASMTPTASTPVIAHTYIFTIVSLAGFRVVSRAKDFISVWRTSG